MDGVAATPTSIVHPLIFGLRNPEFASTIEHMHKLNPGYVVDATDPQAPALLRHCLCGEKEFIYLEEWLDGDQPPQYRYKCATCGAATEWTPSRANAQQLWNTLQTN